MVGRVRRCSRRADRNATRWGFDVASLVSRAKRFGTSDLGAILRGWATLSTGNIAASAISLASIVVAARSLGPVDYGILVTIQALGLVIISVFDCNTDVALMKFGVEALERKDRAGFLRLVKLLLVVDLASGTASLLAAWAAILLAHRAIGIGDAVAWPAAAYSLLLLTSVKGLPAGLLRVFDRYALVPVRDVLGALLRFLVGLGLALTSSATLGRFLAGWSVAEVTANLVFFGLGFRELRRHGFHGLRRAPVGLRRARAEGVVGTLLYTTTSSAIRVGSERVDTLLVGAVLGPLAVSIFSVAKNFANILIRLCDTVQQAVAPSFARLWAQGDVHRLRRLSLQTGLIAALVLCLLLAGLGLAAAPIIRVLFGASYVSSAPILLGLTAAFAVMLLGNLYMSALVSIGGASLVLWISIVSVLGLFLPLPLLLDRYGVIGVCIAHGVRAVIWTVGVAGGAYLGFGRRGAVRGNGIGDLELAVEGEAPDLLGRPAAVR